MYILLSLTPLIIKIWKHQAAVGRTQLTIRLCFELATTVIIDNKLQIHDTKAKNEPWPFGLP
jgi:hypothetical protein